MKRVFVPERYRGMGLGRGLCDALIAAAGRDGFRSMRLDSGRLLNEAIVMYRSLGFRERSPYYECRAKLTPRLLFMEVSLEGRASRLEWVRAARASAAARNSGMAQGTARGRKRMGETTVRDSVADFVSAERSLLIRPARRGEEGALTELAIRSKSYWQYPVEQVEAWRPDLTITPEALASLVVYVAQHDDRICGFFALAPGVDAMGSRASLGRPQGSRPRRGQGTAVVRVPLCGGPWRHRAEHRRRSQRRRVLLGVRRDTHGVHARADPAGSECGSGRECFSPSETRLRRVVDRNRQAVRWRNAVARQR